MGLVVALLALAGLASLLYVAWRRRRLASTFIVVTIGSALLWGLAFAAIWTDYRDADGFVDCWPYCTAFQVAVASTFWYGPVMFLVLGVFAVALATISARRRRGSRRYE
ncbi:MAG TPA: hypothetical protein VIG93_09485 [Gaiellaceae bacterium]